MSDRVFYGIMGIILGAIMALLLTNCASVWWRDSQLAERPPRCHCCAVGSQEGQAQGCVWWVCDGIACPEKTP